MIGDGDLWIGHSYIRTLQNSYKYPDDYGDDPYANSLILSGAMWKVRKELGSGVADHLFHFARYNGDTTLADFLVSVLMQDEETYGGAHKDRIKEIFGNRGISQAPDAPIRLIGTAENTSISLTWNPSEDPDVVGYYVYYRTENEIETSRQDPSVRRDAGSKTSYRVEGLTNSTTYVLKVTAYNIYGTESEYSDYVYATPYEITKRYLTSPEEKDSNLGFCFIEAVNP